MQYKICPPSKKRGPNALLLSVGQSVHKQFLFLFAEVSHIEMKFGMQNHRKKSRSSCLLGMIEPSVSQTSLVFILFHNFSEMIKKNLMM